MLQNLVGKLIVLDGADGVGKTTQTKLLLEALQDFVLTYDFDFPRYDSFSGAFVKECLTGSYGDFKSLSPYLASLPFTLDRISIAQYMEAVRRQGVIVCNRYTPSNIAYQAAKLNGRERYKFIDFLEYFEYEVFRIPRPDVVIYLSVPVEISERLLLERGEELDQHEQDLDYQRRVNEVYSELSESRSDWHMINCAPSGEILSRQEIHNTIFELIQRKFC